MGLQLDNTVPAQTLDKMLDTLRATYRQIPGWVAGCTATTEVGFTDSIYRQLSSAITNVNSIVGSSTSISDFTAYANEQYGGADISQLWNDWRDQAVVVNDWIVANGSGTLTPGQPQPTIDATPLVPELNTLIALSE
jgi:hypothetical protein